jgi:hypothetical protein
MGRSSVDLNSDHDDDDDSVGGLKPLKQGKESRDAAQKRVDRVVDEVELTPGQQKLMHQEITGNDGLTHEELMEIAIVIKRDYPKTK